MTALTIGMATSDDRDGVYFTLQTLRLTQDLDDTELLVVDTAGRDDMRDLVSDGVRARYVRATELTGSAAAKNRVFAEARGEAVLWCEARVLFPSGVIARLKSYYREHPDTPDLLQGPVLNDSLSRVSTHWHPVWRDQAWGVRSVDRRGLEPEGDPFEIPMQSLGVFSCRTVVWPGFNPAFRGSGGEEGYLHEKVRQRGGRCLCLPWLRWTRRAGGASGPASSSALDDTLHNYLIALTEVGRDVAPALEQFAAVLPPDRIAAIYQQALQVGMSSPAPAAPGPLLHGITTFTEGREQRRRMHQALRWQRADSAIPAPAVIRARGDEVPLVSCICPTYNRPPSYQHLIEEAIESFLRQTYPNKELIVINDCPEQELVCDAPGVRVINVPERFSNLGDKRNAGHHLAHGALFCPWDDDDIHLPWRVSLLVERLGDADYLNPDQSWGMDRAGLRPEPFMGGVYAKAIFTRRAFEAVGGYEPITFGEDRYLEDAILAYGRHPAPQSHHLQRHERYYIYRLEASPSHLWSLEDDRRYRDIGHAPVQPGRFELHPHWHMDYVAETRRVIARAIAEARASR